ncbi:unnamed protein product [Rhodiola kirilowii]
METEPSSSAAYRIDCRNKIVQRLVQVGVPAELLGELQRGLVVYAKENKSRIPELALTILPTDADEKDVLKKASVGTGKKSGVSALRGWLRESMVWLQWMMFEGNPGDALKKLAEMSEGQRGVCGISWGANELAYCCRTCEHDPSCAICVPCFQNGNHEGHDYSIINTGNGCCDCGDVTAWKPEGFCSKHKGVEQIQPLQEEYSISMGLVLETVLVCCKHKLLHADAMYHENPTGENRFYMMRKSTSELLAAVAGMLLEFCKHSESLLCLICKIMVSSAGLLDALVKAERYVSEKSVKILRELLLKLLGEPEFKYEFAKVFVNYYPIFIKSAIKENGDAYMKKLSVLPSFSVQLFTVPTVTPRLVKEENLLAILLGCLEEIFSSCAGEDGCLVVSKWERMYEITLHVIHDIGFVMSHDEVPKYVTTERQDILSNWIKLLGFLQGMDALKREIGLHVVEENETVHMAFVLCHYLEEVHSCLVSGVFFSCQLLESSDIPIPNSYTSHVDIEEDDSRHAKVRLVSQFPGPDSGLCLIGTCLKEIEKKLNAGRDLEETHVLKAAEWLYVDYDVSLQEISVHIPLHRLLAVLLHKALEKYCGASAVTAGISSWPGGPSLALNQEFFDHFLSGCSTYWFSSFVMEHPLRVRVFCAQVYAGMWKKNGYAALYACELYGNVQWSDQSLELDLFMLQCCAALAPADSFVNRILQRFGLSDYLSMNVKKTNEYEPTLVKEMLNLLIQIVKERRFCGLSMVEGLKRELIRRLAIGDATHSQLLKSLPPDLKNSNMFSNVLDEVAVYSIPSGFNQGKYSLRRKYWKDLDIYHPRWRPKDLQVAEERYLHFCGTSAVTEQLPKWSEIYHPLNGIARVGTCKMVQQLTRAVLYYACVTYDQTPSRAPDEVLLTALHLLSLALDICLVLKGSNGSHHAEDPIPLLAAACEKIDKVNSGIVEDHSLLSLLVLLMRKCMKDTVVMEGSNRNLLILTRSLLKKFAELDICCLNYLRVIAPEVVGSLSSSGASNCTDSLNLNNDKHKTKARLRQAAILAKMKAEQSKFLESITTAASDELDESGGLKEEEKEEAIDDMIEYEYVCSLCHEHSRSPLSVPVLLQKSRLVTLVDKGPPSWDPDHEAEKRELLNHLNKHIGKSCTPGTSISEMVPFHPVDDFNIGMTLETNDTDHFTGDVDQLGIDNEMSCQYREASKADICSFENLEADLYSSVWKYVHDLNGETNSSAFFEGSESLDADLSFIKNYMTGVTDMRIKNHSEATVTKSSDIDIVSGSSFQLGYDGVSGDCDGIFLSSCGHAVHQECLDRYLSSLRKCFNRSAVSEGRSVVDPNQGEFLCPVCRLLANSALPQCSPKEKQQQTVTASGSFSTIGHSKISKDKLFHIRQALVLLHTIALKVSSSKTLESFADKQNEIVKLKFSPLLLALKAMYLGSSEDECSTLALGSHSAIMWDALKYSLIATEIGARSSVTSLSPSYGLDSLFAGARSAVDDLCLSVFLEASEIKRMENPTGALLRFKGIQWFAKSVCLGHPEKGSPSSTSEQAGNPNRLLNELKQKIPHHDAIFLEHASDPVLAHDPFSSVMWIFFCLPSPFLTCKESFISVVHIFYVVSVTQAIITYYAALEINKCEIGSEDGMINGILNVMGEDKAARHFFRSHYVDSSCGINTFIHRLTFPYLRRCALLSRLLGFSTLENILDRPPHDIHDTMNDMQAVEFSEVKRLLIMFDIPSLDDVLKDETLCRLAIKWYYHWRNSFRKDKLRNIIYSTPAVPFRLMNLPYIYQDLLQRYVNQHCGECGSVPKEPALCLLCGKLCSPFWKPCCRESGCRRHAMTCGSVTGIYLLIRKTTIILHSVVRLAMWPSPYLDAYGEEDVGLQRGRPLFLNEERYATLCHMVATHGLDRDSKVLREANVFE